MKIETLRDVMVWTQQAHQSLSDRLYSNAAGNFDERSKLLLDYLALHEQQLSNLLRDFELNADSKALNAYCYEYFSNNIESDIVSGLKLTTANPEQILSTVMALHQKIIELYQQLNDQFESPAASAIIQELLQLEEHEAMRMTHGSNRLADV